MASTALLKLPGIDGGSKQPGFLGSIEISHWSSTFGQKELHAGASLNPAAISGLFRAAATGKVFKAADLVLMKDGKTYMTITLADAVVTSVQIGGDDPSQVAFTLNSTSLTVAFG